MNDVPGEPRESIRSENVTAYLQSSADLVNEVLDDMVSGHIYAPYISKGRSDLTFAVARKWSSWYPTYFKTLGGCYAFVTRDHTNGSGENAGVVVIDPGFDFRESLRRYLRIEPNGRPYGENSFSRSWRA